MFLESDIKNGFVPFPQDKAEYYQTSGYWENENHIQLLDRIRQQYSNQLAISQDGKSLTYDELYQYAASYGSYLHQQGIKAEDFVVIQSPNVIEFFVVLFGLYYIGARPVFCLNGHGAYEIENISNNSRAVGYIKINQDGQPTTDAMDISLDFSMPNLNLWFRQTIKSSASIDQAFNCINDNAKLVPRYEASPQSVAFLQLSGGTTGLPKLIPRTHAD